MLGLLLFCLEIFQWWHIYLWYKFNSQYWIIFNSLNLTILSLVSQCNAKFVLISCRVGFHLDKMFVHYLITWYSIISTWRIFARSTCSRSQVRRTEAGCATGQRPIHVKLRIVTEWVSSIISVRMAIQPTSRIFAQQQWWWNSNS